LHNLEPHAHETAKKIEKPRIKFSIHLWAKTYNFLKKSQNSCSVVYCTMYNVHAYCTRCFLKGIHLRNILYSTMYSTFVAKLYLWSIYHCRSQSGSNLCMYVRAGPLIYCLFLLSSYFLLFSFLQHTERLFYISFPYHFSLYGTGIATH
jgi:hypothetical protein